MNRNDVGGDRRAAPKSNKHVLKLKVALQIKEVQ